MSFFYFRNAKKRKVFIKMTLNSDSIDSIYELLSKMMALPSVNPSCVPDDEQHSFMRGEHRMTEFLLKWAAANGFQTKTVEFKPGRASVLIRLPATENPDTAEELAYFSHIDTVWTPSMNNPFHAKRKGDCVYGLGSADDKGPLTAGLCAMLVLKELKQRKVNFTVVGTVDEESAMGGIKAIVPEAFKPDFAIIGEGSDMDIIAAHKGIARWNITCRGEAVHASLVPKGRNAIVAAAKLILHSENYLKRLLGEEKHPLLGNKTFNIGLINGGTQPNSVPASCEFTLERRLLPGETAEEAREALIEELRKSGIEFEISDTWSFNAAFEQEIESAYVQFLFNELKKVNPAAKIKGMTAATEAAHVSLHGVPAVVFGPGSLATAHSKDEFINMLEIKDAAKLLASIVEKFPSPLN